MQTWEYKTLLAPDTTLKEFQEKHWSVDALGNMVELDREGETEIWTALHNLGRDGWELATGVMVESLDTPTHELLLIFKRPKD